MRQNIVNTVDQCRVCLQYFTQGVEGEGEECYECAEAEVEANDFNEPEGA